MARIWYGILMPSTIQFGAFAEVSCQNNNYDNYEKTYGVIMS